MTQNNAYYFAQGMTVGFLTFCLHEGADKERLRDCFKELVESYYLLRLNPILMFPHFQDGLENRTIDWNDIDRLLAALENDAKLLQWAKDPMMRFE